MASARTSVGVLCALVIAVAFAACGSDETTTVTETAATGVADEAAATAAGTGEAADEEIAEPDAEAQKDIDAITEGLDDAQEESGASADDAVVEASGGVPKLTFQQASSGLQNARYCASDVIAGPNTSCAFALNVAYDYFTLGRARSFISYSPVTGKYYRVRCKGIHPTICRAGNGGLIGIA